MATSHQRYAFANKHGDDAYDEFVDGTFVKKGSDDLTATHHPNVLALLTLQTFRKLANATGDEFNTSRY
jgi:hypothetical protein